MPPSFRVEPELLPELLVLPVELPLPDELPAVTPLLEPLLEVPPLELLPLDDPLEVPELLEP